MYYTYCYEDKITVMKLIGIIIIQNYSKTIKKDTFFSELIDVKGLKR